MAFNLKPKMKFSSIHTSVVYYVIWKWSFVVFTCERFSFYIGKISQKNQILGQKQIPPKGTFVHKGKRDASLKSTVHFCCSVQIEHARKIFYIYWIFSIKDKIWIQPIPSERHFMFYFPRPYTNKKYFHKHGYLCLYNKFAQSMGYIKTPFAW